jgi:hypothetical protein
VAALSYGQYSHGVCVTTEGDRASEYLCRCETMVSQCSTRGRLSATHLDHDHRKSENVRFLAMSPPIQDFWCSPSPGVTMMGLGTPDRIQVLSNRCETEICETRVTGIIHEDVWLGAYQCDGETKLGVTTYTLEVPVNDITGVEVAETPGYIG